MLKTLFYEFVYFSFITFGYTQTPQALRSDITINKIVTLENDCLRIARDPSTGRVYYLRATGDVHEVNITAKATVIAYTGAITGGIAFKGGGGFTIANDGTFYIVAEPIRNNNNMGIILRGKIKANTRVWDTVAMSEPYLVSGGRDHLFNSVIVMPDQKYLLVNSGSRTDHGESPVNGGREYPITSAIFCVPIDAKNLTLSNNDDSLKPYLFADGVRNSFDMAYTPDGDLIATENGDTRDDTEELNWIRRGRHYGFPWRIGLTNNLQQYPNYNPPSSDPLLGNTNMESTFRNDPMFPSKPDSLVFTDPILNIGPDDDKFRDTDRVVKDASGLGLKLGTFTPHSSPLAIVFDTAHILSPEFNGDGFLMSYSAHNATKSSPFPDPGEDLVHIKLHKIAAEDRYEVSVTRIAQGFKSPVDAVLIENRFYVLENGSNSVLWEVVLPTRTTSVRNSNDSPFTFSLSQNYPNPFNPITVISYQLSAISYVKLSVYDVLGREATTLVHDVKGPGFYKVPFDGSKYPSGIYFYRLEAGINVETKKFVLLK